MQRVSGMRASRFGLTAKTPSFVKKYAQLDAVVTDAARAFVKDVKATAALKVRSDG